MIGADGEGTIFYNAGQHDIVDGSGRIVAHAVVVAPIEYQTVPSSGVDVHRCGLRLPVGGEVQLLTAVDGDGVCREACRRPVCRRRRGCRQGAGTAQQCCTQEVVVALAVATPVERRRVVAFFEPYGGVGKHRRGVAAVVFVRGASIVADIQAAVRVVGSRSADSPHIGQVAPHKGPSAVVGSALEGCHEVFIGSIFGGLAATAAEVRTVRQHHVVDPGTVGAVAYAVVFRVVERQFVGTCCHGEDGARPVHFARGHQLLHTVEVEVELVVVGLRRHFVVEAYAVGRCRGECDKHLRGVVMFEVGSRAGRP